MRKWKMRKIVYRKSTLRVKAFNEVQETEYSMLRNAWYTFSHEDILGSLVLFQVCTMPTHHSNERNHKIGRRIQPLSTTNNSSSKRKTNHDSMP